MSDLKFQNQLHRINGAYQQCMDELQSHQIDTNAFVLLEIERFALMGLIIDEIKALRGKVQSLQQEFPHAYH